MKNKNLVVFALSSNIELVKKVCKYLNINTGKIKIKNFSDGEILIEPLESVRGKNVYIIQSTAKNVNKTYFETLITIDACKRASATRISVIMPYFGYSRQDRKTSARHPITAKLIANLLQIAGANRFITIDLHSPQIQGFFDIPTDALTAISMIGKYYRDKKFKNNVVIVSPDHGGTTRARKLSEIIENSTIAIIDKRRDKNNNIAAMNIIGDVKKKIAIIIDDIIDTGESLLESVKLLLKNKVKKVYCACTHNVFSKKIYKKIENSGIYEILTTDTISLNKKKLIKRNIKIKQISVSYILAKAIEAIQDNKSISEIFKLYND